MKTKSLLLFVPALVAVAALAIFNSGCGKSSGPAAGPAGGAKAPAYVSVEKTSFNAVTAQLDPGGDFYLYLGTAQWLDHLSTKVAAWRQVFDSMPGVKPEDVANINKAFAVATRLIKDSGIEDVTGVGMSSVEIAKGMYRNKAILHHYPGQGDGFLWKLAGGKPHPLTGLDYLPTNTALAFFSDGDLPLAWNVIQKEVAAADLPQAQKYLDELPARFEEKTQVKWNDFLNSLGGEFGLVLTLDTNNSLSIPLPSGATEIPAPGLMLVVKVNNDTIFNRIGEQLNANPQVIHENKPGLKMLTMPVPLPFVGELRPSAASSGGYLFIASSDTLIREALAVKSGKLPGLKSTAEFKQLSRGIPDQGNQFAFVSRRFTETMMEVQQKAMSARAKNEPAMSRWLQSAYHSRPVFAYSVGVNTPEGCVTVGNSSQSYANSVLLAPAVVVGMMAGIAIPNFEKARAAALKNAH